MTETADFIYQNNDWITIIFLIILLTLTAAKMFCNDRLLHTIGLLFSKRHLLTYYSKEKTVIFNSFQTLLFAIQLLVLSLLFYFANLYFQFKVDLTGILGYLWIFGQVSVYFILRFFAGFLIAFIFNVKMLHIKLIHDKVNYFNSLILWIIPFLLLYFYALDHNVLLLKITLLVFVILLIIRYALFLLNNKKILFNGLFYFILYLCALEIAPLLIFIKLTI